MNEMPVFHSLTRTLVLVLLLFGWFPATTAAESASHPQGAPYTFHSIGEPAGTRASATRATLLLLGGGEWPDEAIQAFIAAAGQGHIVVLRASGGDGAQRDFWSSPVHPRAVSTVVFHSREAAFDQNIAHLLATADGIFLAGGDQADYLRFWSGTPVQEALNAHVRGGKPLAGTSAGLAVLGRYVYGCLDGDSMDSARALADPLRSGNTLVTGFLDLPRLEHVLTDSHFAERSRQGRLVAFMARLQHDAAVPDPEMIGLGIDEETGLWVEPDGRARVYSRKDGSVWWFHADRPAAALAPRTPLQQNSVTWVRLSPTSSARLPPAKPLEGSWRDWQFFDARDQGTVQSVDGKLRGLPRSNTAAGLPATQP